MKLPQTATVQEFSIRQPKYSTREVLLATYKVAEHNVIHFTDASAYPDAYYLSGKTIRKSPVGSNGKIRVYFAPLDKMELYEGRIGK